jgi:hypothetical protein
MNLKPLKEQIRLARIALAEAQRIEEEDGYCDAMLSMERTYCEGSVESLEYAYILLNGAAYDEDND